MKIIARVYFARHCTDVLIMEHQNKSESVVWSASCRTMLPNDDTKRTS